MTIGKDRNADETCSDSGLSEITVHPNRNSPQPAASAGRFEEIKTEAHECECDFLISTVGLLSAGIGNTSPSYWLGRVGLVMWTLTNVVHFSLDFYEAKFVFHVSWASTVALFLIALLLCSINTIRYSIPWFIKGIRKLSRHGRYPKTMRRLCVYFKVIRVLIIPLSMAAAMGQFGCYAYDDALDLNFNSGPSTNHSASGDLVPKQVMIFVNILRAASLVHIFYGFWFFLLTHLGMIYMIQCSIEEYIELMSNVLRQNPVLISFSEAVNSFAARSRFVHSGSSHTTGVFTVLLVACSTSFVLNAYNYLFLKKYAIYIWFALAPVIWAVTPLIGAAWVTRHYQRYKVIVVNAWVDVPDDDDDDDDDVMQGSSRRSRANAGFLRCDERPNTGKSTSEKKPSEVNDITGSQSCRLSPNPPSIALDKELTRINCKRNLRKSRSLNDLSSVDPTSVPNDPGGICVSQHDNLIRKRPNGVPSVSDFKAPDATKLVVNDGHAFENTAFQENDDDEKQVASKNTNSFKNPQIEVTDFEDEQENGRSPSVDRIISEAGRSKSSRRPKGSPLFSGIAKTYSRWRARVKAKRKFNFEKYITYLDNTLPNIGFSIGGVVITWDAVSGFCFLLFTLVGIFAQEAFFGG